MNSVDDSVLLLLAAFLTYYATGKGRSERLSTGRKKRLWIKPWISRRYQRGCQEALLSELRLEDPESYRRYLRLDTIAFEALLSAVEPLISKQDTIMRRAIPASNRLSLTLRYLATGESRASLHFAFRIGQSTITGIIKEVCCAINLCLSKFLVVPSTTEEWVNIATEFWNLWNFPLCLGALDGKHVEIRPPTKTGSHFYNYKHTFSVVLLALVDANLNFIYVDVGTNGRISDGGVFAKSNLKQSLFENTLNMPISANLPHTSTNAPFVIVADDAFPLSMRLMKPYPQRGLSHQKRIFNYRLSRARRIVENAFGVLATRFGIFQKPINTSVENVKDITLCCCSLHNFLRDRSTSGYTPPGYIDREDTMDTVVKLGEWRDMGIGMRPIVNETTRSSVEALKARDLLCEYFQGVGSVSWQDKMVDYR